MASRWKIAAEEKNKKIKGINAQKMSSCRRKIDFSVDPSNHLKESPEQNSIHLRHPPVIVQIIFIAD